MADEETTTDETVEENETTEETNVTEEENETTSEQETEKVTSDDDWKTKARKHENSAKALLKRAEAAEAENKKHEDANKTEGQKLAEAKTSAEQRATTAEGDLARLRVALSKGLTGDKALALAKRLVGETEEELAADADELIASFAEENTESAEDDDAKARRPRERLRPGGVPGAEPDETDPRKLAEQVSSDW